MVQGHFVVGGTDKDDELSFDQVDPRRSDEPSESLLPAALVSCAAVSVDLMSPVDESVSDGASPANGEPDPWALTELKDSSPKWNELSCCEKVHRVCIQWIGKCLALICLLYFFVCSLDFLSSAFRLLGGKVAGSAFSDSTLLQNPIAGLMIGVLATVLVQSSSTSSSIIVTMVASGILEVRPAIPIIMGANIGTSVTNTIVSLAQSPNRDEFRRAFGGATVHDMFNWLSVFVLLPLEIATGYMYHLTSAMVAVYNFDGRMAGANADMLQTLTKPFTELIVQLDSKVIEGIAVGNAKYANSSLLKEWCSYKSVVTEVNFTETINTTFDINSTTFLNVTDLRNMTVFIPVKPCAFLFHNRGLSDMVVGIILLVISLVILCGCLILMVKLLNSALKGSMMIVVKKVINADLPGPLSYLTGYIAMLVGAGLTMVVQSSSVFTSALTPLVGIGVIQLERVYPLTLGSNIGTTTTGILASLAASSDRLKPALQIALCHLCFNITGILLFYPIPFMRVPIRLAKIMGNTTAKYRWFAIFYVALMFFLFPMAVFGLSMAGTLVMSIVCGIFAGFCLIVVIINVLQRKHRNWLPKVLRNWDFLPYKWMHSLEPFDRIVTKVIHPLKSIFCCCSCCKKPEEKPPKEVEMVLLEKGVDIKMIQTPILEIQDQDQSLPHGTSSISISSDLRTECESGYASRANTPYNTPYNTPCISRLPSYVSFIAQIPEENEH